MRVMKRSKNLLFLLVIEFLIISCDSLTLSKDEAKQIINEHWRSKGGRFVAIKARDNSECSNNMFQLASIGFVTRTAEVPYVNTLVYAPTEKGKPYIKGVYWEKALWDGSLGYWIFNGSISRKAIYRIDEILIDKQNGIATIAYTFNHEPMEPIYSLLCGKKQCGDNCKIDRADMGGTDKIQLKKYDKGWRVIQ